MLLTILSLNKSLFLRFTNDERNNMEFTSMDVTNDS